MCGTLLPTGYMVDVIEGVEAPWIDNGMPIDMMRASDLGVTGNENRENLDANTLLKTRLEATRRQAGEYRQRPLRFPARTGERASIGSWMPMLT